MLLILYNKVSFINIIFFPLSTADVAVESVIADSLLAHIRYMTGKTCNKIWLNYKIIAPKGYVFCTFTATTTLQPMGANLLFNT